MSNNNGILSTAKIEGKTLFNSFANDEFPVVEQISDSKQIGHGDGYVSDGIVPATSEIDELKLIGNTVKNLVPSEPTPTEVFTQYEESALVQSSSDTNIKIGSGELKQAIVEGNTYKNLANRLSNRTEEQVITTEGYSTLLKETLDEHTEILEDQPFKTAVLQGRTLVNTIQEPCEDDYMVLGSAVDGQNATISNTVQGNIKGAVLGGQTLVNLATHKCFWNGYLTAGEFLTQPLKNNTKYMIILNNIENVQCVSLASNTWNIVHTLMGTEDSGSYKGDLSQKLVFTFNVDEDIIHWVTNIRILLSSTPTSKPDYKIMLIEYQNGMENWDIPYFEGMQSIKMPVLTTTGKNLSPINDYETTVREYATGYQGFNKVLAKNILVNENKEYRLSYTKECEDGLPTNLGDIIVQFSSVPLGSDIYDHNTVYVICENKKGKKYAHITMPNIGQGNEYVGKRVTLTNIQLEEGSVATTYEPYQSNTVSFVKTFTQSMFEQGSFSESTPYNTLPYDDIKMPSNSPTFYTNRIRTITTYRVIPGASYNVKMNDGYGIFICFCKNGLYSKVLSREWNDANITFTVPTDCDEMFFALHKVDDSDITVEDYPAMGLDIYQEVALRGIGDVKDELDLQTGELTQRIGEKALYNMEGYFTDTSLDGETTYLIDFGRAWDYIYMDPSELSNKLITNFTKTGSIFYACETEGIIYDGWGLYLRIKKDRLTEKSIDALKEYLTSVNATIQYTTKPTVKTVDLNIVDQDNNTIPHIQTQPTKTYITTSSNSLIPFVKIPSGVEYNTIIKPSTKYTIRFKRNLVGETITVDLGGTIQEILTNDVTITTPVTLTHNKAIIYGKNNIISEVSVIEGDVVGVGYPFFEGMKSVNYGTKKLTNLAVHNDNIHTLAPDSYIEFTSSSFKPLTKYIFIFDVDKTNSSENIAIQFYLQNTWILNAHGGHSSMKKGHICYTIESPDVEFNAIRFFNNSVFGGEDVVIKNVQIIEYQKGIKNLNLEYFTGTITLEDNIITTTNCPYDFGKGGRI